MNNINEYLLGLDIGSTTVKTVLLDKIEPQSILFKKYERHHGKQAETLLNTLLTMNDSFNILNNNTRIFATGSGTCSLVEDLNAKYIQEVNAVSYLIEKKFSYVKTAIDLGGEDTKIMIWQKDPSNGRLRRFTGMNDKCAGGTGATIDRIIRKLGIKIEEINNYKFHGDKIHNVAGKCGIFAESDINSLQKQGISIESCMVSLFDAIIQQIISTLTKGRTIKPPVLLLGGSNNFFKPLQDNWNHVLKKLWDYEGISYDDKKNVKPIAVPEDSIYFAAIGSVLYGNEELENSEEFILQNLDRLKNCASCGSLSLKHEGIPGLSSRGCDFDEFVQKYSSLKSLSTKAITAPHLAGQPINIFIGLDAGSTSTKAVALDEKGILISSSYQLIHDNPIEETKAVLLELEENLLSSVRDFKIKSLSVTGYAKEFLKDIIGADTVIVETVAHMLASKHYYGDVDVILDVGGQDIKIIFMNNGVVSNFMLNTQCSAGNGFYLQNAAKKFKVDLKKYADIAFSAKKMPNFSAGCGVFLEADIVNYQQQGWSPHEILAGLAYVLPRNIWEYVVQEPNLSKYGKRFVLQGGAHKNLAVIKAQVDYIKEKEPASEIILHKHCAETGAIGAALASIEELRLNRKKSKHLKSKFIGFKGLKNIEYQIKRDKSTECSICSNKCSRTFISIGSFNGTDNKKNNIVLAPCEKGSADNNKKVKDIIADTKKVEHENPNHLRYIEQSLFMPMLYEYKKENKRRTIDLRRAFNIKTNKKNIENVGIGIPRVLNMWRYAPFFIAYMQSIGVNPKHIIWSDITSTQLWKEGSRFNCVDLCFPGKYGISHTYNLIKNGSTGISVANFL